MSRITKDIAVSVSKALTEKLQEQIKEVERSVTYTTENEDIMTITHNGETLTMTKANWNSLFRLSYQVLGNVGISK